eukprot:4859499-Pyramimonas_sp.AAC.2
MCDHSIEPIVALARLRHLRTTSPPRLPSPACPAPSRWAASVLGRSAATGPNASSPILGESG